MDATASRIPPHNLDAERAILGTIIIEGATALERIAGRLRPEDFWSGHHRTLFQRILALSEADVGVDPVTLSDALREAGELEEIGGPAAIALLMEHASILPHLEAYAAIVLRNAGKREAIQVLKVAASAAYNGSDPATLATSTGESLAKIAERTDPEAFRSSAQRMPTLEPLGKILERTALDMRFDVPDLVPTPIAYLNDRFGGGFLRGELVLLGGGPGVAKTALMLEWARYAADPDHGSHHVGIVSLEMRSQDLGQRLLAQNAQVNATALRRQDLERDEWQRIDRIVPVLSQLPIL